MDEGSQKLDCTRVWLRDWWRPAMKVWRLLNEDLAVSNRVTKEIEPTEYTLLWHLIDEFLSFSPSRSVGLGRKMYFFSFFSLLRFSFSGPDLKKKKRTCKNYALSFGFLLKQITLWCSIQNRMPQLSCAVFQNIIHHPVVQNQYGRIRWSL